MNELLAAPGRLGVLIVGLGGAVATTAIAGIELLKQGKVGYEGLTLAQAPKNLTAQLAKYENLVFGGWDLSGDDLASAAASHNVLTLQQFQAARTALETIKPLPSVGSLDFCANITGKNCFATESHREAIEILRGHIRDFRAENKCDSVVMINLASTEKAVDRDSETFASLKSFEQALEANSPEISPAMLYAYAAIAEGVPYANFTPSVAADIPALVEFAKQQNVPIAGKDGKTGQTMMKTVIAPGLRARALKVEGWYSTNILGNRDGLALSDPKSLKSKINTKGSVLDEILGYKVEDHLVDIRYYRPRGDNKESWDNVDVVGFLGQPMQIKINFLCKDSILAAPLVIEIARVLDLAKRRGASGVQEQMSVFFKLPQVENEAETQPVHALHLQEQMLYDWLARKAEELAGANPINENGNSQTETIAASAAIENAKH
ncbi:MAG: inositol-3-phosphate synthase [Acidobacteriota bacterium]|nr:inositol-3-phosphate synthase [Acidobacteriota bacterium]